jgi:hypothetical protein
MHTMGGRVALVTGASAGIGRATHGQSRRSAVPMGFRHPHAGSIAIAAAGEQVRDVPSDQAHGAPMIP